MLKQVGMILVVTVAASPAAASASNQVPASATVSGEAPQAATSLRVVTYNVWGIPVVTPDRAARIAEIPGAVAEHRPDLVALQEVWTEEDTEALARGFAREGLPHSVRFDQHPRGDSGLMVVSRFPLSKSRFEAFSAGHLPRIPWHLDWIAAKGVGIVRVETPAGPVDFADTHLQSAYGTKDYLFVQISQALEAIDAAGAEHGVPVLLAGDFNAKGGSLPFRWLVGRGGFQAIEARPGIDTVLFRRGADTEVEIRSVQQALRLPRRLATGAERPLSDHPAVIAEFVLRPSLPAPAPVRAALSGPTVMATLSGLRAELNAQSWRNAEHWGLSGMLLLAVGFVVALRRRRSEARWVAFAGLIAIKTAAAAWFIYLGAAYGPHAVDVLTELHRRVEAEDLTLGPSQHAQVKEADRGDRAMVLAEPTASAERPRARP